MARLLLTDDDAIALEAMVDRNSIRDVVNALAEICSAKAEHLRANWQDTAGARAWERWALALDNVVSRKYDDR